MAEAKSAKKAKKEAPLTETGDVQRVTDFLIKPESSVPKLDTSKWPLLLKVRADTFGTAAAAKRRPFTILPCVCSLALLCSPRQHPPAIPQTDLPDSAAQFPEP